MAKRDDNLRIGQEMYIFLRWLYDEKMIDGMSGSGIADPFNITDEYWLKWLEEFRSIK